MDPELAGKAARYARRVQEVYPELRVRTARLILEDGQYNDVLVVNGELIFRFPRLLAGVKRLETLVRVLRVVRRHVALATPEPVYSCTVPAVVGQAFLGYPRVPGEPLWQETFDRLGGEDVLQAIATQAATFLKELHSIPPDEAFPGALARFDPLAEWADLYARIRERLFPHMRPDAREGVAQHFEAFLRDPGSAAIRPALTHGDYGGGNLLFDPQTQRLTGVIDFDHAGVGDPAVDFAAAQGLGLRRLAKVYPEVEAALDRVRFYGGTFALQEALYGAEHGDDEAFHRSIAPYA